MIGKVISHYKVLEELGRGGMGVVYKAEDTKLKRTVALKFLPADLTRDQEARDRFIQEARAASGLDHPNVCTVYEIDETDAGEMFIAMAYYRGETLREKIERGPLTQQEAIDIASQIAHGLGRAHEADIIHRDIKPANVMVTDRGEVKILDFGLAKLRGRTKLTKTGNTMGTVAYMSPEQVHGQQADHRTDVWSFGVVLYEMLTGQLPFKGEIEQAVMYSIVNEQPGPLSELRQDAPKALEQIVSRCLKKEREDRYQSEEHLLTDLKKLGESSESGRSTARAVQPAVKIRKRMAGFIVVPATLVVAMAFFIIVYGLFQKQSGAPRIVQTRLLTPSPANNEINPALSPDGTRIAYGSNESGNWDIWVQRIASGQKINLTKDYEGNDGAPCWSPDGEWIAFSSDRNEGGILVISAFGGNPRPVTTHEGYPSFPKWSPDGTRLVYSTHDGELFIVPTRGGTPEHIPLRYPATEPSWSPAGNRIAFSADIFKQICTIGLDGSDLIVVVEGSGNYWNPIWTHDGKGIFFKSDRGGIRDIWWVPVDPKGKPIGPAKPVTVGVGVHNLSLSQDGGRVAYTKGTTLKNIWSAPIGSDHVLTMDGALRITSEHTGDFAVSPDREWIVFSLNRSGNWDLWLMRKNGQDLRQLTTDQANDFSPTWSPDGRRIAFRSDRSGNREIYLMPAQGGLVTALTDDPAYDGAPAWSPDGKDIVFLSHRSGNADLWVVSVNGGDLRQLTTDEAHDINPAWSPNGGEIAFASNRTSAWELYTLSTADDELQQLTHFGAGSSFGECLTDTRSVWSLDGQTIYVAYEPGPEDPGRRIWAISVEDGSMRKILENKNESVYGELAGVLATDGERIYFKMFSFVADLWLAELAY